MFRHQVLHRLVPLLVLVPACDRHAVPPGERRNLALVEVIPEAPNAAINKELLECGVAGEIIDELEDEIDQRFNIRRVHRATGTPGDVLGLRFAQAEGTGGGMVSGSKRLVLEGFLFRDGEEVASFTARRTASFGFKMGYYQGTCSMVEDLAEELAEDIAEWLLEPRKGARIGER